VNMIEGYPLRYNKPPERNASREILVLDIYFVNQRSETSSEDRRIPH